MRIGVIGATGNIGQRVVAEAVRRAHSVVGLSRDPSRADSSLGVDAWRAVDVLDPAGVVAAIGNLDVLVSTFQPGNAARDFNDAIRRSIADPSVYVRSAKALLSALESYPSTRLIVVGGAGSLEARPGVVRVDQTDQMRTQLENIGLPADYVTAAEEHRNALNTYRVSNRLWTYLSPADYAYPGERTCRYRVGGDQLLVDADGQSRISYEDLAVAVIDEAELPRHIQRRFTIAY